MRAPRVVALYRHPLKGFTPESCERLTVLPEGRIAGDRVLALRFADAPVADDAWCRKYHGVVLANTPGLARLETTYDPDGQRLGLSLDGRVLADERLDGPGRARIAEAVTRYVMSLDENPLKDHPQRLPVKLVGDGNKPRYQDSESGQITLHGRETLAEVGRALGDPDLSELRFRSNIAIEGLDAWEEQSWVDRRVRIGAVELNVIKPKVRCLATHANPVTGKQDLRVMQGLVTHFKQREPTFAVGMLTHGAGGTIHVGDEVRLLA